MYGVLVKSIFEGEGIFARIKPSVPVPFMEDFKKLPWAIVPKI